MIYFNDILIPILCPIQFTEPKETLFYQQDQYMPKLIGNGGVGFSAVNIFDVQIRISHEIYDSSTPLHLVMNMRDGENQTFVFTKHQLSAGYEYATATIDIGSNNDFAIFEIKFGDIILADSLVYELNPLFQADIKKIRYTNSKNDLETIFVNGEILYTFEIDVECGFKPNDFDSKIKVQDFEEQDYTNKVVYGLPYFTEKLTIGDGIGIPNWLWHKLTCIWALDSVTINGLYYEPAMGTKVESLEKTYDGHGIYSIELQRKTTFAQNTTSSNFGTNIPFSQLIKDMDTTLSLQYEATGGELQIVNPNLEGVTILQITRDLQPLLVTEFSYTSLTGTISFNMNPLIAGETIFVIYKRPIL